ncbi:UvrD-helicase domain-containing protein [Propionimicrobium sp. PCR01-08-3]|uniref:UvrD-helicase domain-containing protein n=1 Tax=Propionimicrobium sp. PCR01-08-3 TaxID=3052086 RepID=UPI00255CCE7C|nr:UvrD-helicase domain-containing protein [Propionimicrobium sp. PCR01-08-3]WIY83779.1 UvrD-helicase domain-containing protein [Propionimicrobium sp. PCR01-08-3]
MNDIFRLDQPLPAAGTTLVLEASAGTGKTFTIAAMVARYVAAGTPLDRVLAVTFSRRATNELRDGIRHRLISTHGELRRRLAGLRPVPVSEAPLRPSEGPQAAAQVGEASADPGESATDQVTALLSAGSTEEVELRARRLAEAIGRVDDAPIFTLHTFASRMLDELGILADYDTMTRLETDPSVLIDEVIADVYLADERWQQFNFGTAVAIGRASAQHGTDAIYPSGGPEAAARARFAADVRTVFATRKRALRQLGYDDMITRLAAALTDPVSGPQAARTLSERFSVVLVDEFQDTDPAQWAFLEAGFAHRSTVLLIGDPKQAIYRFRGGDIETYSAARERADVVQRLGTNYRSDAAVVTGIENLFGPIDLGSPGVNIEMQRVDCFHRQPRLRREDAAQSPEAVQVRAIGSDQPFAIEAARALIVADLVSRVGRLLDTGYQILDDSGRWRPLRADDIAILVSTNKVGRLIHASLQAAGYPSVFTGEKNVFASQAAADWLVVLEALVERDRWHRRRAMLSCLIGWTSADISSADEDALVEMTSLFSRCARRLSDQGITAVFETLVAERHLDAQLLGEPGGEELLSDLRHVTELLNHAQSAAHLSPSALTEFLRRSIDQAGSADEDERTRRLPTDRPAVRVMTVHKAKGLQFPIVLLPEASDRFAGSADYDQPVIGHVEGRRVLDVDSPAGRASRIEAYQTEDLAESLRSFYVACTRAQSLLVCWWAPTKHNTSSSPLHRLLMNNSWHQVPQPGFPVGFANQLRCPPGVAIVPVHPDQIAHRTESSHQIGRYSGLLDARRFSDHIDRDWTRTSYTGLTAGMHDSPTPPDRGPGFDEVDVVDEVVTTDPDGEPPVSALAELVGGTQFGSLVHAVLEEVDPASPRLAADLSESVRRLQARYPLAGLDSDALTAGLEQIVTTPLGVLTDDLTLRALGAANRLAELDFEVPLGGSSSRRAVADLADCFSDLLDDNDPLHGYGELLKSSGAAHTTLAGFLTGSIDVVLQLPTDPHRYVILDYKTNRLTGFDPATMTSAMCQAHYPLQALLYEVALHRYLGWRLPGYRPESNLGGVGYLFVRGMSGADNPANRTMPSGVFTWRPPAQLIVQASEVLAGGS